MSNLDKHSLSYTLMTVGQSAVVEVTPLPGQVGLWLTKQTAAASLYAGGESTAIFTGHGVVTVEKYENYRGSIYLSSVGANCSVEVLRFFTAK